MVGEWQSLRVGDLFELVSGFAFKSADFRKSGGVPVLKIKNVKANRIVLDDLEYVDPSFLTLKPDKIVRGGDILITMSGNRFDGSRDTWVGKVAQYRGDQTFLLNQRVGILRPKNPKQICSRSMAYFLSSEQKQELFIAIATSSGGQANLSPQQILGTEISVPPLDEQQGIARVIGDLEDKIELNRITNETLEAMARALFKSWFVDFDPVRAKANSCEAALPAAIADLFPDSFEKSELGEIPTGWQDMRLGEVLTVIETGGRPKGGVRDIVEGIPSVGAESIVGLGVFDYAKTKYVPTTFFEAMKKGHIEDFDVLLYKDGGRPGEFEPHATLVGSGFPFEMCSINEHVYRLRSKPTLPQPYLYFWITSDAVMDEMRVRGTGVAIPGLNSTAVRSLGIVIPSPKVLQAFDEIASTFVRRIFSACNESRQLAVMRDELLPRLISGDIRVGESESEVANA